MSHRILVCDNLHQRGLDLLTTQGGFDPDVRGALAPDELVRTIGEYEGLIVRSNTVVTAEVLANASKLKLIGRAGTGVDNIDVREATRRGVIVMNAPGGNAQSAAEHTLSMIMALHRDLHLAVASMKAGKWEKKKFQGTEITGRTLGVIGLGRIGSIVAKTGHKAFRMKVIGYDPLVTAEAASQIGVRLVSLDEVFAQADVLTVHTPLSPETRNLIDARAIAKMKDGVYLVNCARGGIVDEDALLAALESGKVGKAALDVFTTKPPGAGPLVTHPRVITTPHLGASTGEAQEQVAKAIAEQFIDYFVHGIVRNAVNMTTTDPTWGPRMRAFLDLAGRLAQFAGRLSPGNICGLDMEYHGKVITSRDVKPVTTAALVGLLSMFEGADVNPVNAWVIAEERGIRVSETRSEEGDEYGSSIVVRVTCADNTVRSVQGALLKRIGFEPRIIGIDQFVTEAVPAGAMLVVGNRDIPGMVHAMTGVLARSGINIAQMNLSRVIKGGSAISIINIDSPADEATLRSIADIPGILSVNQVILEE
ncbi:MAG: phosphoglycerate dehydrogenase [Thermodesulfobacteriota bacterium]